MVMSERWKRFFAYWDLNSKSVPLDEAAVTGVKIVAGFCGILVVMVLAFAATHF